MSSSSLKAGMVCAAQPEAVEAGVEVLRQGGNAVDAAVATALVQAVVDPQMCGIGGFGCMNILHPIHGSLCLDFYARAPLAAREDMWAHKLVAESADGFGFFLSDRSNELGYQSVATPATLLGLDRALVRLGTRRLAELLAPAIEHAREGVLVRPHMAAFWDQVPTEGRAPHRDLLTSFEATRRIYLKPDGSVYRLGESVRNTDLADTLARLGEAGVEDFFHGGIAERIAADMRAHDGLLTARDLNRCRARESEVLEGRYRGHVILTNPPPGGGATLIQMLNILENFDLAGMGHNSARYIATVAEAMKIGAIDRERYLGDPEFVDVPLALLLSKSYAADLAQNIRLGRKVHVPRFVASEARDTTQACVVDAEGICVSLTHSLGTPSGVVSEGLGFMYNGAMAAFDPRPGRAGSIAPGKARTSSIAPTIVLKAGAPFLVLGAPGGTFITPGILQAILNVVDFGMNALEAVSAPRFCATSDVIGLTNRIPRAVERALVEQGYPISRTPYNYYYAGVHAIRISEGKLDGGADPGRDGMALMA